ncbi:hypothetical protein Zmor_002746 [Zophobas morio]|uniref:Uncharacterized protein n=1 Tax=Zophobas morio TaxID=2755281 RepID=A0AA38M1E9_9CUCU|nr:hypothetical protein Zmor_002745 [Zophobas morio]KAJ3639385.1 hypothetical protein Zmor_002746 [Zophobas morio]
MANWDLSWKDQNNCVQIDNSKVSGYECYISNFGPKALVVLRTSVESWSSGKVYTSTQNHESMTSNTDICVPGYLSENGRIGSYRPLHFSHTKKTEALANWGLP